MAFTRSKTNCLASLVNHLKFGTFSGTYVYNAIRDLFERATSTFTDPDTQPATPLETQITAHVAKLVTAFQATPDDTHYPSEKLTKDNINTLVASIATKEPTLGFTPDHVITVSAPLVRSGNNIIMYPSGAVGSDVTGRATSSESAVIEGNCSVEFVASTNDLIKIELQGWFNNCIAYIGLYSGSAVQVDGSQLILQGSGLSSHSVTALFRATGNGNLQFFMYWYKYLGTATCSYRQMVLTRIGNTG